MHDSGFTPPTVPQARGVVAGLHSHGAVPDPAVLDAARATLATSLLDREIRTRLAQSGARLNDAQVGHLVGLLLIECGVAAESIARIEADVRAAVRAAGGAR